MLTPSVWAGQHFSRVGQFITGRQKLNSFSRPLHGFTLVELLVVMAIIGVMLVPGCGDDGMASVSGLVTLDGQSLSGALVQFRPASKAERPALGATDNRGKYKLATSRNILKVYPGSYTVSISKRKEIGDFSEGNELLPARYNSATELRVDVPAGDSILDFPLTSDD